MQTISDGSTRSHTLTGLEEDSSYTITVRANNTVGMTMATITADTSNAGEVVTSMVSASEYYVLSAPSGMPGSLSFSAVNLTSITVQWTELPCSDRNGEITGYTVEYSSTTPPPHSNTVNVSGSSTTRLVVGSLLPRTSYTFSVRAVGAFASTSPSPSASRFTSTPSSMPEFVTRIKIKYLFQVLVCS